MLVKGYNVCAYSGQAFLGLILMPLSELAVIHLSFSSFFLFFSFLFFSFTPWG